MVPLSSFEQVEFFHLTFLRLLEERVDKRCYVLKGGCNLRFFFGSTRYSEDLDLDCETVAVPTLAKNVELILTGKTFAHQLRARDLEIARHSAPKQTDTTQRWKISLRLVPTPLAIHTKIEFSRRAFESGAELAGIDPAIAQRYQIPLLLLRHYGVETAVQQKIHALLNRTETQARDIFDLNILLSRAKQRPFGFKDPAQRKRIEKAIVGVSYDDFRGQVAAYLTAAEQDHYGDPQSWEQIQRRVIALL